MENSPAEEKWMEKLIRVRYIYNNNNNSMNNAAPQRQVTHTLIQMRAAVLAAGKA